MSKEESKDNSFGVASVVLGILGIVSILLTFFAVFAPIAGLILSVMSLVFANKQKKINYNSWAKSGFTLSIIGIILNIVIFIWLITSIVKTVKVLRELKTSGALNQLSQVQNSQLPS